jgi:hypothetical protein
VEPGQLQIDGRIGVVDDHREPDHVCACLPDQVDGRLRLTADLEPIVDDDDPIGSGQGIFLEEEIDRATSVVRKRSSRRDASPGRARQAS